MSLRGWLAARRNACKHKRASFIDSTYYPFMGVSKRLRCWDCGREWDR